MKKLLLAMLIMIASYSLSADDINYESVVTIKVYTTIGHHSYKLPTNAVMSDGKFMMQTNEEIKMASSKDFTITKITASVPEFPEYEINCGMDGPYHVRAGRTLLMQFSKNKLDVC